MKYIHCELSNLIGQFERTIRVSYRIFCWRGIIRNFYTINITLVLSVGTANVERIGKYHT